jgi:hypothetical protein
VCNKVAKNINWRKICISGDIGCPYRTYRRLKLDPYPSSSRKKSKCIKDLNVRPETERTTRKRKGNTLRHLHKHQFPE